MAALAQPKLEVLEAVMQGKTVKTVALANADVPGDVCCSHCWHELQQQNCAGNSPGLG